METKIEVGDWVRTPHGDEATVVAVRDDGVALTEHEHADGRVTRGEFESAKLQKVEQEETEGTEGRDSGIPPGQRRKRLRNLPTPTPNEHPPATLPE